VGNAGDSRDVPESKDYDDDDDDDDDDDAFRRATGAPGPPTSEQASTPASLVFVAACTLVAAPEAAYSSAKMPLYELVTIVRSQMSSVRWPADRAASAGAASCTDP